MDSTDTSLSFDQNGICDRCREYEERIEPWRNHGHGHDEELQRLLTEIKKSKES